jgi:hypothetical protein
VSDILGPLLTWARENAWIASWLQFAITVVIVGIDLYVVLWILYRQVLGPVPPEDRPALGKALASFAAGQATQPVSQEEALLRRAVKIRQADQEYDRWIQDHA